MTSQVVSPRLIRFASLAAGLSAVASLSVLAAPANAAPSQFNIQVGYTGAGGSGNVYGAIDWQNRNKYDYSITANDQCPTDGYGVAGYFATKIIGTPATVTSPLKAYDSSGCADGVPNSGSGSIYYAAGIKYAAALTCFTQDGECRLVGDTSTNRFNPYAA